MGDIPQIPAVVNNPDMLGIMISLGFMVAIFAAGLKKGKSPIYLSMVNFMLFLLVFVNQSGVSEAYAFMSIVAVSFLTAYLMDKSLLEGQATESKIFINYIIFFITMIVFMNYTNLSSDIFSGSIKKIAMPTDCSGLLLLTCGWNMILNFVSLFGFSSSITLFNTLFLLPFLYFLGKYFIYWMRGRGA